MTSNQAYEKPTVTTYSDAELAASTEAIGASIPGGP